MSSNIQKGQQAQSNTVFIAADQIAGGSVTLHEQKLAAWHLAIGEPSPVTHPPGRLPSARRSNLPDVDWALAVPYPTKPSRISMIAGWVRSVFAETKDVRRHRAVRGF